MAFDLMSILAPLAGGVEGAQGYDERRRKESLATDEENRKRALEALTQQKLLNDMGAHPYDPQANAFPTMKDSTLSASVGMAPDRAGLALKSLTGADAGESITPAASPRMAATPTSRGSTGVPETFDLPDVAGKSRRFYVDPNDTSDAVKSRMEESKQRAMERRMLDVQKERERADDEKRDMANRGFYNTLVRRGVVKPDEPYNAGASYESAFKDFTTARTEQGRDDRFVKGITAANERASQPVVAMEDGKPTFYSYNKAHQSMKSLGIEGVPKAGGAGGKPAQGAQAPIQDMIARYAELKAHGNDIGTGKFTFGTPNSTREALKFGTAYNQSEGKPALMTTVGGDLMDMVGATNPDTQNRYDMMATANRAMGDDAAKVFKGRQGFQNIGFEVAQQKFDKSDIGQPEKVAQKLDRMKHIIQLAATVAPEQLAGIDPKLLVEFGIAPPVVPGAGVSAGAPGARGSHLTDAQVKEAMDAGAQTSADVRKYWAQRP